MSNAWSDAANWLTGVPVSDPETEIVFASAGAQSASTPNSFQNLSPDPFQLASLTFSLPGSDSFSLGGGALSASTAGGSILTITQNSAGMVTVGNNLSASFAINIGGDGTGLLVLNGTVSALSGGLTKSGTSTVQFNGDSNLYGLMVDGGTLIQTAQQTISRTLSVGAGATYNLTSGSV